MYGFYALVRSYDEQLCLERLLFIRNHFKIVFLPQFSPIRSTEKVNMAALLLSNIHLECVVCWQPNKNEKYSAFKYIYGGSLILHSLFQDLHFVYVFVYRYMYAFIPVSPLGMALHLKDPFFIHILLCMFVWYIDLAKATLSFLVITERHIFTISAKHHIFAHFPFLFLFSLYKMNLPNVNFQPWMYLMFLYLEYV